MQPEVFLAFTAFVLAASCTPGPNNVMLLASGVNFGFTRTIPHMAGITAGMLSLLLAIGFGLGSLMTSFPVVLTVLKILGGGYLLYLAWRIAFSRANVKAAKSNKGRPMRFMEAAAFQWVNPKAWIMGSSALAIYSDPGNPTSSILFVAIGFPFVAIVSVVLWSGFGVTLQQFLSDSVRLKWFNIAMGVVLALTILPMLA